MTLIDLYEFLEDKNFDEELNKWTSKPTDKNKNKFLYFCFEKKYLSENKYYQFGDCEVSVLHSSCEEMSYYSINLYMNQKSLFSITLDTSYDSKDCGLDMLKRIAEKSKLEKELNIKTVDKQKKTKI